MAANRSALFIGTEEDKSGTDDFLVTTISADGSLITPITVEERRLGRRANLDAIEKLVLGVHPYMSMRTLAILTGSSLLTLGEQRGSSLG